ncbi:MAG: Propionyl-CoA carboxylase, carboxyltransferase subunit [Candidatus Argoarchaeum ethanivorans]|uniref:Propionyl-CoA carboxylase, carboxyltransferase subunit n=1 Tax=Candidatus Argoarchaeum ethanivorans TaxID=2608793 RepID=A0A811T927_9EURY|nr:MAG: Propionyl-CoA carboxylase, carboxyltransferase subunit [Candidatus Argoarchaeum ethanivorans]
MIGNFTEKNEKVKKQHTTGKLTARERIEKLIDPNSFVETNMFAKHRCIDFGMENKELPTDGVVTGYGKIDGRLVFVFSQDFTVMGGSIGEMHAKKICDVIDLALKNNAPLIGLYDSGGARVQEGIDALSGCGQIFYRNSIASGRIPQISAIMGPCAGAAAYSPALTDFIFMVRDTSYMFLTGPQIIKTYTGEDVAFEKLGGAGVHNNISGVADFIAENDEECLQMIRELLGFLPSNCFEDPSLVENGDGSVDENITNIDIDLTNHRKPYDMHEIIKPVMDTGYFFEVKPNFAQNIIIGFSRLEGRTIGIVANQPEVLAGSLDADSSDKAARFIRFCDAFNIPIVTFVDVPGFLPGIQQEHRGIIKHGAKMLFAYSEATVPKITIIIRKAYGGAFLAMCSKDLGADQVFALPNAEIAVMGPEGAVNIIFKRETDETKKRMFDEYQNKFANPYFAASRGHIDVVIEPRDMRKRLISALQMLSNKREEGPQRKHGIIPL